MNTAIQPDLFNVEEELPKKTTTVKCGCCGVNSTTYVRKINCNMVLACICLYRFGNGKYCHVDELLRTNGYKRCGDFSYLRFYGILQAKQGLREDGSRRNGMYRLTSYGIMFLEGKVTVKEKFIIKNNKLLGFSGGDITAKQAAGNKFDFSELMAKQHP